MSAIPLTSPREIWERPRDIFDYLVDENGDSIVLDDMTRISVGDVTRPHNVFTPVTHPL